MSTALSRVIVIAISLFIAFNSMRVLAQDSNQGVLTLVKGQVEVFANPMDKPVGDGPFIQYEGKTYNIKSAKIGIKLNPGDVIRTGPEGKARLVFTNGDNIAIGPYTSYVMVMGDGKDKDKSNLNIIYGKVRALISQSGPRTGMKVNTTTAVVGVRGTDFYVAYYPQAFATQIAVLRGEVAVAPKPPPPPEPTLEEIETQKAKEAAIAKDSTKQQAPPKPTPTLKIPEPVIVKAGFTAELVRPKEVTTTKKEGAKIETPPVQEIKVAVRQATQQDLAAIQTASYIKPEESVQASPEVVNEIKKLETQAKQTTLQDIKKHDPVLFAKIESKAKESGGEISSQDLNNQAIMEMSKLAPKGPTKPSLKDYKIDEDVYKKYFKKQ